MARQAHFAMPTDPTQFTPLQIKPRALLGLAMNGLATWFAEHLRCSYSSLLTVHRTAFVFTTVRLDYAPAPLRLADLEQLTATVGLTASNSAKYLHLDAEITTQGASDARRRHVATFRADLRVVSIVEDEGMTAVPGLLPDWLFNRFLPGEIYQPNRAAIARAATRPDGLPTGPDTTTEALVLRSHCEAADQWSFIELMELLTTARERFFLDEKVPPDLGKLAAAGPIRSMTAVFERAMYVFDTARITTRAYTLPSQDTAVMFGYDVEDAAHLGRALTAWETLGAAPAGH